MLIASFLGPFYAGSNLVCTSIFLGLARLFRQQGKTGKECRIEELHVQVDNCVGENKNNFLIAFLSVLVAMGTIGVVEVHFMMVGHTHIKIDQVFSRYENGTIEQGGNLFTVFC